MMSSNRSDYKSASEWLSTLMHDEAWLTQQQQLQSAADAADADVQRDAAIRRIGIGETYEFWEIHGHQVEKAVSEVWEIAELSLPKLKIQTIGMLSMAWLEQHTDAQLDTKQQQEVVEKLAPIFYGQIEAAREFLVSIKGMKPKQITNKVNQLVCDKKISQLSSHRDLWQVLHDYEIYTKTESNWNMQVK